MKCFLPLRIGGVMMTDWARTDGMAARRWSQSSSRFLSNFKFRHRGERERKKEDPFVHLNTHFSFSLSLSNQRKKGKKRNRAGPDDRCNWGRQTEEIGKKGGTIEKEREYYVCTISRAKCATYIYLTPVRVNLCLADRILTGRCMIAVEDRVIEGHQPAIKLHDTWE
jgi:hypothetical protein